MATQTEERLDFPCPECWHDIDNHSYKGCLVKSCKCELRPSAIAKRCVVGRILPPTCQKATSGHPGRPSYRMEGK